MEKIRRFKRYMQTKFVSLYFITLLIWHIYIFQLKQINILRVTTVIWKTHHIKNVLPQMDNIPLCKTTHTLHPAASAQSHMTGTGYSLVRGRCYRSCDIHRTNHSRCHRHLYKYNIKNSEMINYCRTTCPIDLYCGFT